VDYYSFLFLQFIAHLLADFFFQTDRSIKKKHQNGFFNSAFIVHISIVFLLSWILSLQWNFFIPSLIIALLHYITDALKSVYLKKEKFKHASFFIDQIIHLLIIFWVVTIFAKDYPFNPQLHFSFHAKTLLVALAYLLCAKPTNIIIKEIFNIYNISIPKNGAGEIPNAGKLIGIVERILTLTLVLNNQYEAVGFLIAAKSILRFNETEVGKSEYVLVGSLLSFGIALLIGIGVHLYK